MMTKLLLLLPYVTCLVIASVSILRGASGTCTSGVLRLQPFPDEDYSYCFPSEPTSNSIKALCNVASKVTVTSTRIIKMVPLVQGTFNYSGPGPSPYQAMMNCKDLNASGLFNSGSTTAATVMLYDDLGGPLSNLTKTGPHQVTLAVAHTYSYKGPPVACNYNYTVVSGCVMGANPPTKPAACPAGYMVKKGRFGIKYCSPCPPGTSSKGPNSATCKPCPAGTFNRNYAGKCKRCDQYGYAPKAGSTSCEYCSREYDNKWTDGLKCENCPAGSFWSPTKANQCLKCNAGKKCCTVNWTSPTGDCPKCAPGTPTATYTSIFAFYSASSPYCLASNYARCAPKINITVGSTCQISLSNLGYSNIVPLYDACQWTTLVPIKGAKASAKVDLAMFPYWDWSDEAIVAGNVTNAAPPYLTFYTPKNKCTFKYRALTKPAASLLGVAPKRCPLGTPGCPTASSTCPAGRYREVNTDMKPGPCLYCPPGTYAPKASKSTSCKPCPASTYAAGYGSRSCKRCPGKTVARTAGSASCSTCSQYSNSVWASPSSCQACPANTGYYYSGFSSCLANAYGSVCCAAGDCTGQPACPASTPSWSGPSEDYNAVLQLVSKGSLSQATCKNASFLACLPDKALLRVGSSSYSLSMNVDTITPSKCKTPIDQYPVGAYGGFASSKRAILTTYIPATSVQVGYEMTSNKAQGTITINLSSRPQYIDDVTPKPELVSGCSATFKLIAGYTFDLTPPAGAKCPSNAIPYSTHGRTFCNFCQTGEYKNSTGACATCPAGTYQNVYGATSCKKCPAGFICYAGNTTPYTCQPGDSLPKAGALECKKCPANTYSTYPLPAKCPKCPPLTTSIAGSSACGVLWDK